MSAPRPYVVGITGGIGCGKSVVAGMFAELGAAVVDTDAIAHELTGPGGAAMAAVRRTFGARVIGADGALDRAAMRRLAFDDPAQRKRLEAILHPLIRELSTERVAQAQSPYVVLVVPLLIESGSYRERVDRVAVVDCSEATQIARVQARSGLSEGEVRAIMAAQVSRVTRLAAADDVLDNDTDIAALHLQVVELDQCYRRAAQTRIGAVL